MRIYGNLYKVICGNYDCKKNYYMADACFVN